MQEELDELLVPKDAAEKQDNEVVGERLACGNLMNVAHNLEL